MRTPFATLLLAFLAGAALAADLPAELAGYEAEGEKWFNVAGNVDLGDRDRNEARKNAYVNLWKAKEILDRHWEEHPEDQNRIEERIMSVGQKLFWIKKESPIGLLESTGVGPQGRKREGGTNTDGRRKQSDWPDAIPKPREGAMPGGGPTPEPPTGGPEEPGGETDAPAEEPSGPTIEDLYSAAKAYSEAHRADVAGVLEAFQAVLLSFPEATDHPLFAKAAEEVGRAQTRMKEVYRRLRNADPDALENADSREVRSMVVKITKDLRADDAMVRKRAATLLGNLGSGEAAYALVKARDGEDDEAVAQSLDRALLAIGGAKVAEHIGSLRKDRDLAGHGLDLLVQLAQANPVDARLAAEPLGAYALHKDDAIADRALQALIALGADGSPGLLEALGTKNHLNRIRVIEALGRTGDPRVASPLSQHLIGGDVETSILIRKAAMEAIKALGEDAVPYAFDGLRNGRTKAWTSFLLREMTGQMLGSKMGPWQAWWKREHPDWKR